MFRLLYLLWFIMDAGAMPTTPSFHTYDDVLEDEFLCPGAPRKRQYHRECAGVPIPPMDVLENSPERGWFTSILWRLGTLIVCLPILACFGLGMDDSEEPDELKW